MYSKVMKRLVLATLMMLMVCVLGSAMAETVDIHTNNVTASVNGMPSIAYAFPHNLWSDPEAQIFFDKYQIDDFTAEELDQKYAFTLEADDNCFQVVEDLLKFTKTKDKKPQVALRAISKEADGKTVKIIMSSRETGETLHVMEYVYSLKSNWTVDIQCSKDCDRKFVSGKGEVLTVVKGSDLDLSITIEGINETLDVNYQWLEETGETPTVLSTTNTLNLKNIQANTEIIFEASNDSGFFGMMFINIEVVENPFPTLSLTSTSTPAAVNGVITAEIGEKIVINTEAICSDPNVNLTYTWKFDGEELAKTDDKLEWKAEWDDNGKTVSVTVEPSAIVKKLTPTTYTYRLNVVKPKLSVTPTTTPAAVDGVITVTEGDTITINANPVASQPDMLLSYDWAFDEVVQECNEKTFTFTATKEHNGQELTLDVRHEEEVDVLTPTHFSYKLNVKKHTLAVTPSVTPAAVNGVITVTEGDTVTINANAVCSYVDMLLGYEWAIDEVVQDCSDQTFSFVAAREHNGLELTLDVNSEYEVDAQTPTHFSYQLNVEKKPVVQNLTWSCMLGGASPQSSSIRLNNNDYLKENFFNKFDYESLTITATAGKGISNLQVDNKSAKISFKLSQEANGELITVKVISPEADVYIGNYKLAMNTVAKGASVNKESGAVLTNVDTSMYDITVTEGNAVTVKALYETLNGGTPDMTYDWHFATDELASEGQKGGSNSFTFVPTAEYDGIDLICFARNNQYPQEFDMSIFKLNVKPATFFMQVGSSPKAVAKDDKKVITVTEGANVAITAYPECSDPSVEVTLKWLLKDKNGKSEALTPNDNTCSFSATKDHNGAIVTVSSELSRDVAALTAKDFSFELVVNPKPVEPVPTPEVTTKVETTEFRAENVTEDLVAVIGKDLNLEGVSEEKVAKIVADVVETKMEETIKEKAAEEFKDLIPEEDVEIPKEQTVVYEVELKYSEDNGKTWQEATEEHWPESGKLDIWLPYPEGTNRFTTKFVVAHMFTETTAYHKAGDIEYPAVTNTVNGIHFQVSGLSPIALAWTDTTKYEPVFATFATSYESGLPAEAVTEELKQAGLNSVTLIKAKLETEMKAKALSMGKTLDSKTICMTDVTLKRSDDNHATWTDITMEEWNGDTVYVFLPYPKGTNANTHDFLVAHMFASDAKNAGKVEFLNYVTYEGGVMVEVTSMSPFAIASFAKPAATVVPATGDSASPMLWVIGMLLAGIGCAAILGKRRQNG